MSFKTVPITEGDIGDALFSEILGIPLIMRGTSSTRLADARVNTESLRDGRTLCEKLGLPLLSDWRGKAKLSHGTTFGKIFPEILR